MIFNIPTGNGEITIEALLPNKDADCTDCFFNNREAGTCIVARPTTEIERQQSNTVCRFEQKKTVTCLSSDISIYKVVL